MTISDPEPKLVAEDGVIKGYAHGDDGLFKEMPFSGMEAPPPSNGGGGGWTKGNFVPVWKLQSAATQPSGGTRVGRYAVSDGLVVVSYLLAFADGMELGQASGDGTSRYYFELPPEIPDISNNVAEHGTVRMFDGRDEYSGVCTLYNSIPRAVIAEVEQQKWGINTPFSLLGNTRYISLGIYWIP